MEGVKGDTGRRGPIGIWLYNYNNVISGNCMYVGLRGDKGKRGYHNTIR